MIVWLNEFVHNKTTRCVLLYASGIDIPFQYGDSSTYFYWHKHTQIHTHTNTPSTYVDIMPDLWYILLSGTQEILIVIVYTLRLKMHIPCSCSLWMIWFVMFSFCLRIEKSVHSTIIRGVVTYTHTHIYSHICTHIHTHTHTHK